MIKTTLKAITEGTPGLNALLAGKLPIKAKYAVAKLARACQAEMEHYEKERKAKFEAAGCELKKYMAPGANGEQVEMEKWVHPTDPKGMEPVIKELEELGEAEVEINALPLDLDQFGTGEIEGPAFYGLDWAMKA